jgi:hypothetical protein
VSVHHDFWVVVGTAAPVIALAAVVSYTDLQRAFTDALGVDGRGFRRMLPTASIGAAAAYANFILQGFTLVLALLSLANGDDVLPLVVAEITLPLGIFLLLLSSSASVFIKGKAIPRPSG